jgi:hypothetical protein
MTNQSKWHPTELTVKDVNDVELLIRKSQENRAVAKTELNAQSSRSHCIYQIRMGAACLNLIDLAGSERIQDSKVEGVQKQEALAINKSLTSL